MALLKTKDIRDMRPEDRTIKLQELKDELMHERGVAAMGGAPASPGKIRALRTNVARMFTIMLEKERAEKAAPAKAKAKGIGASPKKASTSATKKENDAQEKEEKK
ncbi:MAG: 50S ribosomal protein L29 [Thermoplasmata archaeon]|nr:50S ribosomal protein L29 [Thermoplasmata archaeon]